MGTVSYLKRLVKDPQVASITPTSSFGVERIVSKMDFNGPRVIVEYGPGEGVFTRRLLEKMNSESKLIAIETNETFVAQLQEEFDDPRVIILNDSAENIGAILQANGAEHADYIISGIPFSMFPVALKDKILKATNEALTIGGSFFVYQFVFSWSGPKKDIKHKLDELLQLAASEFELRCIPPLRVYQAKKRVSQ